MTQTPRSPPPASSTGVPGHRARTSVLRGSPGDSTQPPARGPRALEELEPRHGQAAAVHLQQALSVSSLDVTLACIFLSLLLTFSQAFSLSGCQARAMPQRAGRRPPTRLETLGNSSRMDAEADGSPLAHGGTKKSCAFCQRECPDRRGGGRRNQGVIEDGVGPEGASSEKSFAVMGGHRARELSRRRNR